MRRPFECTLVVAVRCRHVSPTHAWLEIVFAHEALVHLGFFSFNKLLMHRDLAVDAWPENALATHSLTRGLLYEGFEGEEPALRPEDRLDEVLPPEKLFHVVDADASQATVIEEARRGRNLVVQGPPGTGKSQTITNIIAAAASEGKRVLFLAEKMAALSVVYERLVKSGLRDVCLELHSKAANKKSTLGEIGRTLSQASATANVPGPPTALKDARDRLNDLTNLLHRQIGTSGDSLLRSWTTIAFSWNTTPPAESRFRCHYGAVTRARGRPDRARQGLWEALLNRIE